MSKSNFAVGIEIEKNSIAAEFDIKKRSAQHGTLLIFDNQL